MVERVERVEKVEEIKVLTEEELKAKYPTKKRIAMRFKPFANKACLLCNKPFGKAKVKQDGALVKYVKCSGCGLVHYSNIKYPEIMLVSKDKELEHRGKFRYQEEMQLYSKVNNKEEDSGIEVEETIDGAINEGLTKATSSNGNSGLVLSTYGSTPIYYGARE